MKTAITKTAGTEVEAARARYIDALKDYKVAGDYIYKFCKKLVKLIDDGLKDTLFEIAKELGYNTAIFADFEKIGRGMMDERLIAGGGKAKQFIIKLPLSTQKDLLDNGADLVVADGTVRHIDVGKIASIEQCKQLFNGTEVRSEADQLIYIDNIQVYDKPAKKCVEDGAVVVKDIVEIRSHSKCIYKIDALEMNRLMNDILTGRNRIY